MLFRPTPTSTELGHAWAVVLDTLASVVAPHVARCAALIQVLTLAYHRILRTITRLDRLILRHQTNTLPPTSHRRPSRKRPTPPASVRLPTGHVWLIRLVQPAAQIAGQVAAMLAHPDTQALVKDAPQAGRLLRPLCQALGIPPPDWLRLPPRAKPPPTAPPPAAPPPAAPPADLAAPGTPDRPLPRHIRAAVRAWRKKPA